MVKIETVREATSELVEAVNSLVRQLSSSACPPSAQELVKVVTSPATTMFVARLDGEIVGMLTLVTFRIPTGMRALIEDVVVSEKHRGRGIGQMLTEEAIAQVRSVGVCTVDLTSRSSREAANRLYQRLGFVRRDTNVYRLSLG